MFPSLLLLQQLLELLIVVEGSEVLYDDGDGQGEDQHAGHCTGHAHLNNKLHKISILITYSHIVYIYYI